MRSKPFIFQLSGDLSRVSLLYWHSGIIISVTSLSLDFVYASRRATQQLVSPELQGNQRPPIPWLKQKERERERESIQSKASTERKGRVSVRVCWLILLLTDEGVGYNTTSLHLLLLPVHQPWHTDFQDDKCQLGLTKHRQRLKST